MPRQKGTFLGEAHPNWKGGRAVTHAKAAKKYRLKQYGMTMEEWDAMLESQQGCCAICGKEEGEKRLERLAVDHDHETGKVRGILCLQCNLMIGNGGDDPDLLMAGVAYLLERGPNLAS